MTPAPFPRLVPGRAYTFAEKKAILDTLLEVWSSAVDLRLGQLLVCSVHDKDLFFVEDLDLLAKLAEFRESIAK